MTKHTTMTDLAEFDRGWLAALDHAPVPDLIEGLVGLTRFAEHPVSLERLAIAIRRPVAETEMLLRENITARIEAGLVYWDVPYPGRQSVRTLHIGARTIPTGSGCAPDLFAHAAVLDVPFDVDDHCAATGASIRIEFIPGGVDRVTPSGVVTAVLSPEQVYGEAEGNVDQINTNVCLYQPFFSSVEAAEKWLAEHPGGRVFTPMEMFERPIFTYYRDNLRPLIHSTVSD